jgi:pimeloyl-ACP methyl ester carboxylesterase
MKSSSIYRSVAGERAVMARYDRALEGWPVPCEKRTVATRHGATFVLSFGDHAARPLILLHGAATNSSMWAADASAYARRFHVFAVDLPGEAGKSTPNRPPWSGPAFADWLGDVLDGLGLETAMIAGISQGGWAALKFAAAAPHRVERLVVISPAGVIPDRRSFVLRAIPCAFLGGWGARQITRMVFAPQPPPAGAAEATAFMMRHFKARIGIVPRFSDAELRAVNIPALLLGGDRDALRDVAGIRERLSGLVPHLQSELIANGGHALLGVADRAIAFLESVIPTPAAAPRSGG